MIKNLFTKIINAISFAIIIVAILLLISVVMTKSGDVPDIGGYSFLRVITGSMEPEIKTGSVVVVKDIEPSQVQVGDVISFYFYDDGVNGAINTHRVTNVEQDGQQYLYTTKGDANVIEDSYKTKDSDLVGKVVFHSYIIGVVIRLAANPLVFFPLIIVPLIIMLILNVISTIKSTKEIVKREERQEFEKILAELEQRKKNTESECEPEEHCINQSENGDEE